MSESTTKQRVNLKSKSKKPVGIPQPNHPGNIRRSVNAQTRLKAAYLKVAPLVTLEAPMVERMRLLADATESIYGLRVSKTTLTKHKKLWHPRHMQ